ncbi:ribose 5-phosphate isomerase B [Deltaproteobacteria bacterium]|nr:ribose 5-phosphate isomerase B [Deltaproteobacteria bacterium]
MRIVTGSDHGGLALKTALVARLRVQGHQVVDVGTHDAASCDYPDYAVQVGRAVAGGAADFGLLVCGTGQGMAMTANRIPGVRAAVVADTFTARATRQHNDANVLCLGERVVGPGLAGDILDAFLGANFEGGRHAGRIAKFTALEKA